jgi:hypothetical protein
MTIPVPTYSPKLRDHAIARKFVSQNGRGYMAIGIFDEAGNTVDADAGTLTLNVTFDDLSGTTPTLVITNATETSGIVNDGTGMYHFDIGAEFTTQVGLLNAEWTYAIAGVSLSFFDYMQVLEEMPFYEHLTVASKQTVEQVSWFFGDLFDSTAGGPWLQENYQTHFTYERIAQLSAQAVMKLNFLGFPVTNWGVTITDQAIPANYQALNVWGTKLEVIRHLALSYTEQPDFRDMQVTYTDRRDYSNRWQAILAEEAPTFEKAVIMAKRALLSLGRGSLLVSGGIYSTAARGFFVAGMYASQTRAFRFYPAAPAVTWGNMAAGSAY